MKRFIKKVACFAMAAALIGTSIGYSPATTQAAPKTKKIVMNKKKVTLEVGKTFKLKVKKVTPKKASKAVSYKSNKKKIAKVSKKGKITAVAAGSAKITVTSKKNKKAKATVKVTVIEAGSNTNTPQGSAAPSAVPTGAVSGTTAPTAAPTGNAATNTPRASRSPRPSAVPSTPTPEPTPPPMDPPSAPYELDLTRDDIIVPQGDATAEKVDGGVKVTVSSQYSGMAFNIPDDVVGKNFDTVTVSYKDPKNTSTGFGCGLWRDPNDKNTETVIAWNGYFPLTNADGNAAPTSGDAVISLPEGDTTAFYVRKCLFFFNDADSLSTNGAAEVVITKIVFSHSQYQGGGDEPTPSNGPTPTEAVPTEEPKNPAVEGKELVVNGDFSDGANGWTSNLPGVTNVTVTEGYASVTGRVNNYSGILQVLDADYFEKDMIIDYSFKVKLAAAYAENPAGQSFAIAFNEDDAESDTWFACKGEDGNNVVGSADEWITVKGQYTVQKDIRKLKFIVAEGPGWIGDSRKGDFYIDDVTMKVAGKAEAPTASPIPTPDLEVAKTDADITVDGAVDEAWSATEAKAVENYSGTKGDTTATAKLLWKSDKLYILIDVKDSAIDATSANAWERDGVEFFLDEDCSKEATYDANTDAFQYRYTGFSAEGTAALTKEIATGSATAKSQYAGIETAYKVVDGGYVVEASIPLTAAAADKYMGFEITVMDCAAGKRNNEISLLGAGGRALYNTPSLMGVIKLVDPQAVPEPELAESLKNIDFGEADYKVNEDGSVTITGHGTGKDVVIPIPETPFTKVIFHYSDCSVDSLGFGVKYKNLSDEDKEVSLNFFEAGNGDKAKEVPAELVSQIKSVILFDVNSNSVITIKSIEFVNESAEPSEEPANNCLDLNTISVTDGSEKVVNDDGSVTITCKGQYTGGITIDIPAELAEGAKKIVIEVDAEAADGAKSGGQFQCVCEGEEKNLEVYNWNENSYDDTVFNVEGKKPTKLIINSQGDGMKFTIKKIEIQR